MLGFKLDMWDWPLTQEMAFIERYLDLQKARLEDRWMRRWKWIRTFSTPWSLRLFFSLGREHNPAWGSHAIRTRTR